jgi:hypothetical protein
MGAAFQPTKTKLARLDELVREADTQFDHVARMAADPDMFIPDLAGQLVMLAGLVLRLATEVRDAEMEGSALTVPCQTLHPLSR